MHMFLKKILPIIIGTIGKNKYYILHWQNIGKTLAVIGNQYFTNRYQYIITLVACVIIF